MNNKQEQEIQNMLSYLVRQDKVSMHNDSYNIRGEIVPIHLANESHRQYIIDLTQQTIMTMSWNCADKSSKLWNWGETLPKLHEQLLAYITANCNLVIHREELDREIQVRNCKVAARVKTILGSS